MPFSQPRAHDTTSQNSTDLAREAVGCNGGLGGVAEGRCCTITGVRYNPRRRCSMPIVRKVSPPRIPDPLPQKFTREQAIVRLLAQGLTLAEIQEEEEQ